jgi:sugar/nucleoside kinase (ribokinase family)
MTFSEIDTAIKARTLAIAGAIPVSWPNKDFTPGAEYIEIRHQPVQRIDTTGTGDNSQQDGLVLFNCTVRAGIGETRALQIADLIRAGFPKALRLAAGAGNVVITKPADPRPGFTDGTYYRLPVVVSYTTERP